MMEKQKGTILRMPWGDRCWVGYGNGFSAPAKMVHERGENHCEVMFDNARESMVVAEPFNDVLGNLGIDYRTGCSR